MESTARRNIKSKMYREYERAEWADCFYQSNFEPHWYLWDVVFELFTME